MKGFLPRTLHPGLQVLLLLALMVAGACVGYTLVFTWARVGYGLSLTEAAKVMAYPTGYPQGWGLLMAAQG
ncbi:hypothetical protein, partial [Hymenobacter sp.]|uniref:hypothetical protein n=1 Tax=Hymenobacter sp. TaxID=1898978 RepID=UPI00286C7607